MLSASELVVSKMDGDILIRYEAREDDDDKLIIIYSFTFPPPIASVKMKEEMRDDVDVERRVAGSPQFDSFHCTLAVNRTFVAFAVDVVSFHLVSFVVTEAAYF